MREVYYAADIGNYLFKDCMGNLVPAKTSLSQVYNSNSDVLKLHGKTHYIGEGEYEINVKKYEKSNYLPLLLAGICKSFDDEYIIIKLGVGLPLNQFKSCKNEVVNMLEDTKYSVVFNGKPKTIEITTVISDIQTKAKELEEFVSGSQLKARESINAASQTKEVLASIVEITNNINSMISNISLASEKQSSVASEILESTNEIMTIATDVERMMNSNTNLANRQKDLATEQKRELEKFKLE